jgi:hypothetical protein
VNPAKRGPRRKGTRLDRWAIRGLASTFTADFEAAASSEKGIMILYLQDGAPMGPVDESELVALVRQGIIGPETLVRHDGMADWKALCRSSRADRGLGSRLKGSMDLSIEVKPDGSPDHQWLRALFVAGCPWLGVAALCVAL